MHSVILGTDRIVVLNVELEMRKLIPKIMYKRQSKIEFKDTERELIYIVLISIASLTVIPEKSNVAQVPWHKFRWH